MSEATTPTLTEFLFARLDEDEAIAHVAANSEQTISAADRESCLWTVSGGAHHLLPSVFMPPSGTVEATPDRVLAEVTAKRRIVGASVWDTSNRPGLELACLALASVYADHPDYRDEWRA